MFTYVHMCDMAHSYVRHGSFTCVAWLIIAVDGECMHVGGNIVGYWHTKEAYSHTKETYSHTKETFTAHSYVWHDSLLQLTASASMSAATSWDIVRRISCELVAPDSVISLYKVPHMKESCPSYDQVISRMKELCHIWTRHSTHVNASHHTYEWVMSMIKSLDVKWVLSRMNAWEHVWMSLTHF